MKKKLVVLLSLILVMCSLLCACGSNNNTEYVEVGGERYGYSEFYQLVMGNELKRGDFEGEVIIAVGNAKSIEKAQTINGVHRNTSFRMSGYAYTAIMDDDSYDDVLASLDSDNLVRVTGNISFDDPTILITNASVEVLK